mmetsp:Transcript_106227/g.298726  ORF Transcript_106227/g.298726 Transcript_106227/m.298726 type:complete len:235 (+) Transcript_106227:543-1247(+)
MAFLRICCMARWSITSSWKFLFSASRTSPAFFSSTFKAAMPSCAALVSATSWSIVPSRAETRSPTSASSFFAAYACFSPLRNSSTQDVFCLTSLSCCAWRSATMTSIAVFTFVNASSFTCSATVVSCSWGGSSQACHARPLWPAIVSASAAARRPTATRESDAAARCLAARAAPAPSAARWRRTSAANVAPRPSCKNEGGVSSAPNFLWKRLRASSSVRMVIAPDTAFNSSLRA